LALAIGTLVFYFGGLLAYLAPFLAIGAAVGVLAQLLSQHFGGLAGILNLLKPVIDTLVLIWQGYLYPALVLLWDQIKNQLLPALQELWNQLSPVLLPVLKYLGMAIGFVLIGAILLAVAAIRVAIYVITGIVEAIGWWVGKVHEAIDKWVAFGKAIPRALSGAKDAIINAFRGAFDWLKEKLEWAKNALQNLNPFHRGSPSLVDMVRRGTDAIVRSYGEMFAQLGTIGGGFSEMAAAGVAMTTVNRTETVVIRPGFMIGTPAEARRLAEMVQVEIGRLNRAQGAV